MEQLTTKEMIVDADLEAELRQELDRQVEETREEVCMFTFFNTNLMGWISLGLLEPES